jgi:hypothetical protein
MAPFGLGHIWYWFLDRPVSPWYPRAQVRRQQQQQTWADMIAACVPEIAAAVTNPGC